MRSGMSRRESLSRSSGVVKSRFSRLEGGGLPGAPGTGVELDGFVEAKRACWERRDVATAALKTGLTIPWRGNDTAGGLSCGKRPYLPNPVPNRLEPLVM